MFKERIAIIKRKTSETDIMVKINLDGYGKDKIKSEIPFLNHMLILFCKHGFFDLEVNLQGDLEIDAHHSLEDLGICMGRAIREALGDKKGIKRYGYFLLPMDESLVRISLDISGRGRLFYRIPKEKINRIGNIDGEIWQEYFLALAYESGITLHIDLLSGENTHHIIEAIFKGLARALDQAVREERRLEGRVPSSKGMLA